MKNKSLLRILATSGFSGLFAATALAADQTWNTGGPSDTWNTSDLNWDAGIAWTNGNTAIFSGTGEAIGVGSITAAGMTFSGTGYTLSGGTINHSGTITASESATVNSNIALSANQSWTTAAGKTLTLGGAISGTSTLAYGGSGSYVIGGLNSNSGNLTIDTATVTVNTGATLFCNNLGWSNRSITISNGGTLAAPNFANGAGNLWGQCGDWASNVILTSGGVFKMTGTTMDSTVNKGLEVSASQTGYFRVATGSSAIWNGRNTGRDFNSNTGATLVFDGGGDFETARYLRGAGNVTKNDGGTLKLTDVNGFTGTLTVNGGTVEAPNATTGGSASATGTNNAIVVNSGATLKYGGSRGAGYHTANCTINGGTVTFNAPDMSWCNGRTLTFDTAAGTVNGTGQWRRRDGGNKVVVTAAASGSVISVAELNLLDNNPVFDVADGAQSSDLTISSGITGGTGLVKSGGGGTLTLTGTNTYSGAVSVNAGTLLVNGSLTSAPSVTVNTGATLGGTGTFGGTVTVAAGGTLQGTGTFNNLSVAATGTFQPAGTTVIGTVTVNNSISLAGATQMEISKAGAVLTNDQIAGSGTLAFGGTLTVTHSGDPLALGDSFTLFANTGAFSGAFTSVVLPTLPAGLSWDQTNLQTTGVIQVVDFVATPLFSPVAGNYVGAQSVSITSDSGSTIYYTTDGSAPTTASANGPSPITGLTVPTDSSMTIRAFAKKAGQADSPLASADYVTLTTARWNEDANGLWSDAGKWLSQVIPNAVGAPVDFHTLAQTGDATVTLDSNRTVGRMDFGNANNFNWILDSSGGSVLTLATGTGSPTINILDNTTTISAVMTGTQGLVKTGPGNLVLSAANTWTGDTIISEGNLQIGNSGAIPDGSTIQLTGGSITGTRNGGTLHFLARNAASTFNMSSGSLTLDNTGQYWDVTVGNFAVATYNQSGGTAVFNAGEVDVANNPGSGGTSINVSGGSFTVAGAIGTPNKKLILGIRGNASFNISSSANVTIPDFLFGHSSGVASTATLNLDGGTLLTQRLSISNGTAILNLNGGLLKASADNATFLGGLTTANVRNGGARFDTNAHDVTIAQALVHSTIGGDAATDGGLVKSGAGKLVLTGSSDFNGDTAVNEGTLQVEGSLTASPTVTVATGATLGGSGSITGTINAAGAIAPGSSVGTLATGTLTLSGQYTCQIDGITADRLNVTGDLNLTGSTLQISEINPATFTSPVVILTYTGTLTGNFPEPTLPSGMTLEHDATAKEFRLIRGGDFYSWATANSVTGGPNGDSDNDGISNLVEYSLALNPAASDGQAGSYNPATGVISFTKRQDAIDNGDVTYVIQTSPDLVTWTPDVTHAAGNTSTTISTTLTVDGPKKFARLSVSTTATAP